MTILVAGVGNELKGDDAFGLVACRHFQARKEKSSNCVFQEVGIGGIHLVQELMRGYDALILFDAFDRGGDPGQIWLLEPELPEIDLMSDREKRDFFADVHYATAVRALTLAKSVGALPSFVRIIGCQPSDPDSFATSMSKTVEDAVSKAVHLAIDTIEKFEERSDLSRRD